MRLSLFCLLLLWSSPSANAQNRSTIVDMPHVHVLEHAGDSEHPSLGPSSAPVTIEFFVNLASSLSGRKHGDLLALSKRHPERLRIVYRLTEDGAQSRSLAQTFAQEAFKQGRFFEFLRAFYGERRSQPSSKDYPEIAAKAGLNYKRVQDALEWMRHDEPLAANHFYWRRSSAPRLPALVINGRSIPNSAGLDTLESFYDAALAETYDLQSSGLSANQIAEYQHRQRIESELRPSFSGPVDGDPSREGVIPTAIATPPLLTGGQQRGPKDAKVVLVFFCHLQSTLCQFMSRQLDDLLKAYPNEVRLVFHVLWDEEQPLEDKARFMHEAALCADEQGAFWEYFSHAFDQRSISFDLSLAVELAGSPVLNLNVEQFEACLETGRMSHKVTQELAFARQTGATRTPALAVGGILYPGRMHFTDIRYLVEQELGAGIFASWASSP